MSSMNQKANETGWFYHAPAKRIENPEPVGAPPPSQIPGLGEIEVLPREEPREVVFRDTDSKYIRMAKMGGRKNLLTITPNSTAKKEAVSYPRNEWFYLEDNALEDKEQEKNDQWQFMLPEYMVHQSHGATTVDEEMYPPTEGIPMRHAPYATEEQSQFSRDGRLMTDKTVKIPETRAPGYGVRSGKPAPRGSKMAEKTKPLSSQIQGDRPRLKPLEPEEPTNMSKLLSNTYEKEWHDRIHKQGQGRDRPHGDGPATSEYKNTYSASRKAGSGKNREVVKPKEEEKKEPFKMTKFKNVPARINSHQSPEVLAAVGN